MEEKTILYIILILVAVLVVYLITKDFIMAQGEAYIANETTGEIVGSFVSRCTCKSWRYVRVCSIYSCPKPV